MDKEISFKVLTMTGVEREFEAREDLRVDELIEELENALELAHLDAEGRSIKWRLQDQTIGRTLPYESTLAEAGVKNGHKLLLIYGATSGCFAASTKVLLPTDEKLPLERIKLGEFIVAFDPETESFSQKKVLGLPEEVHAMQIIVNNKVIVAPDQQLLLKNGSWKRADELVKGDRLWKSPFREIEVKELQTKKELTRMISPMLEYSQCYVVDGFIARNFVGKQTAAPKKQMSMPGEVDVFLSYSVKDEEKANSIYDMLGQEKITAFLADKDIAPGQRFEDTIKEELKRCRNFWILITPNSLGSEWVITEWAVAWALEKTIVPILLHCRPEALPKRLQAYQCVDFHDVNRAIQTLQSEKKKLLKAGV